MARRSPFGTGAYVVRYAWWAPLVPGLLGLGLIAGFGYARLWRLPRDPKEWHWIGYVGGWLVPMGGLALVVLAASYVRRASRRAVAMAVTKRGVYWCPSGDRAKGEWFPWDNLSAIEFHSAEGGSAGRGAVALRGYAPPGEEAPRLISSRLGGWRVGRRRLRKALQRFAPHVRIMT